MTQCSDVPDDALLALARQCPALRVYDYYGMRVGGEEERPSADEDFDVFADGDGFGQPDAELP